MTRTERATFPRALMRDRSESKSGLDKSFRKGGSGNYNWGNILELDVDDNQPETNPDVTLATEEDARDSLDKHSERRSNSLTDEDKRIARDFRKTAFKGQDIDLSAIARTSAAASTSPPTHVTVPIV